MRSLTFTNRSNHRVLIIFEPWAEQYWIEPGQQVDIHAIQKRNVDRSGNWEVEQRAEALVFHGWEGCVLSIFCRELVPSFPDLTD
jgi:hypothetical protein